jgi:hypothetical protein
MPKFKSNGGGHVSLYVPWRETPVEVPADGHYETDDKQELKALRACAEVSEVEPRHKKS